MMLHRLLTIIVLALSAGTALANTAAPQANLLVSIEGAVLKPGSYRFEPEARLRNASATALVRRDAWFLGAALLRQSAIEPQQRLKAGVLFELHANRVHAMAENNLDLHALADHLYTTVEAMPVTGRVPAQLDPLQQMLPANNMLLQDGDRIIYPRRPDQVRVLGAVERACTLPFAAGAQPVDYLADCAPHRLADPSWIYVVQPNGTWSKVGLAGWNREKVNIAVGAVLYVPLRGRWLAPDSSGLNDDMAALLATQYRLGGRFGE